MALTESNYTPLFLAEASGHPITKGHGLPFVRYIPEQSPIGDTLTWTVFHTEDVDVFTA